MVRTFFRLASAVLVGTVILGCDLDEECPDDRFVTGHIISISQEASTFRLHLRRVPAARRAQVEEAIARFSKSTPIILKRADGSLASGDTDDLMPTAVARVCITGVEYRSDPPQYDATKIAILSSPAFR